MAKYRYERNKRNEDYVSAISFGDGRVLELGKTEELSAEEVDFLRRNYVLTKVQDDQPVKTGK